MGRSLVIPVRRDRAVHVRGAGRHGRLPGPVLRPGHDAGRLSRFVRPAARHAGQQGIRVDPAPQLRRARRVADPADPPLGRADICRGGVPVAAPAVFHRRVPPPALADLADLGDHAHPGHGGGLDRHDLAGRLAVGRQPGAAAGCGPVDPGGGHPSDAVDLRRQHPRPPDHSPAVLAARADAAGRHGRPAHPPALACRAAQAHPRPWPGGPRPARNPPAHPGGRRGGAVLFHLCGARAAECPRPDQPGLAARALPARSDHGRDGARLVHGLPGRRIAHHAGLAAYPLLERKLTGDHSVHLLPDRPRDAANRTALGAAGITFYGLLWAAAANDQIAYHFSLDLYAVTWFFRVAVLAGPLLAYALTQRICLGLARREREEAEHGHKTGQIVMSPNGGYSETTRPVTHALEGSRDKRL